MTVPLVNTFAETAALYAVLCDDHEEARRIVGVMFPSERAALAVQLEALHAMLTDRFGNGLEREPA